jgi:hypothetical protein
MACQKNNPLNGTNFYKQNIQGIKSRSMCWTYQTKNLPYKESLHLSRMRVYKFVELNSFGSNRDVLPNDLRYVKLIIRFVKCDETFCNKVKLRSLNKKR